MKCMSEKKTAWQTALIQAITTPELLLELLELDPSLLPQAKAASQLFPLKVPRGFLSRIEKGNAMDPLLQQILPIGAELSSLENYTKDPLQEIVANPVPGLLHKYQGRVLLTTTGACSIHCRYCFRRHFPYADNNPGTSGWHEALRYIANDPSIHEVILSGGDPLTMSDHLLGLFSQQLEKIPHVKRLRIHTRMPVILPERITPSFIAWINDVKLDCIIVLHTNHPNEIDDSVIAALQPLRKTGIPLLNQAVLLKGINDNVQTLIDLSEALFHAGILPYYLHVLDKVEGAAHFDLPLDSAQHIHGELTKHLSGYLVPKLVKEEPGAPAKLGVGSQIFYTA